MKLIWNQNLKPQEAIVAQDPLEKTEEIIPSTISTRESSTNESAKVGIVLSAPLGKLDLSDSWMGEFTDSLTEDDEITEEIPSCILKIDLAELQQVADPFDDKEYLSIQEINLFEQGVNTYFDFEMTENITAAYPIQSTNTAANHNPFFEIHQKELRHIAVFCLSIFTASLIPYTTPVLADYRPWQQGEKAPFIGLWAGNDIVVENSDGTLVTVANDEANSKEFLHSINQNGPDLTALEENIQEHEDLQAINEISWEDEPIESPFSPLEARSPAMPEHLFIPKGALDHYFERLSLIEDGRNDVARALVWGDSTIASDGIIKDVRARMQERFGDSGPGFLAAQVDPRWALRRDIVRNTSGSWSSKNIVFGGAEENRYGLAGTVSIAKPGAISTLGGVKIDGERQDLHRFQVFYQRNPNGGDLKIATQSKGLVVSTNRDVISDGFTELIVPSGDPYVYLEAQNNNVVIYGVALEVDSPGITWETFGVAGASISSLQKQQYSHLHEQIAARDPALLVYWTGGNELGYPSVKSKNGAGYKKQYAKVVKNLREGAPAASCLLIGPLDQAYRENGVILSKPTLDKLISLQKEVAMEEGCAYWDARAAMGGANSFGKWLGMSPPLASPDLAHLTARGREKIGETLADVLMREFDIWRYRNPYAFWYEDESISVDADASLWECENPEEINLLNIFDNNICKL